MRERRTNRNLSLRVIFTLVTIFYGLGTLQLSAAQAQNAETSGFSAEQLNQLNRVFGEKVAKGDMAGTVILVARHGKIVHLAPIGFATVEGARPMRADTIFRAYSMTKPVVAVALMMLYEQGAFQLDDPISKYLPEFRGIRVLKTPESALSDTVPAEREPTIHDLLRHTAGLGHGFAEDAVDKEYRNQNIFGLDVDVKEMTHRLAKIPLLYQPGSRFFYSVSPDIEARLVEVFSGLPFDVFVRDKIFQPLGMKDSGFWVEADRASRLATLYWKKEGKLTPLDSAHGYPKDGGFLAEPWSVNSYTENHPRKGGSYGLLTTATDYWRFSQMLLNGGVLDGHRLLSPRIVDFMTQNHMPAKAEDPLGSGTGWGLGFAVLQNPALAGQPASAGTFYWSGAANTHFWIDPKADMVVVVMAQDLDNPTDSYLRERVMSIVYGALNE